LIDRGSETIPLGNVPFPPSNQASPSGNTPVQPGNETFQVSKVPIHAVQEALKLLDEPLKLGNEASSLFNEPFPMGLAGSTASLERTEALRQQQRSRRAHQSWSGSRSTVVSIPRRKPRISRIEGSVRVPSRRM